MVDIATEKDVTLTMNEVKGFLKQMDEEEEFDEIELDAVALASIAGGSRERRWFDQQRITSPGVVALACVR